MNKDKEGSIRLWSDYTENVYAHILNFFEKLEYLTVTGALCDEYPGLILHGLPSNTFSSSILTYLNINVLNFIDCLYLLDGRLKQLRTFIVRFHFMDIDSLLVSNMADLPNLKSFSLICYVLIENYDNEIVSLLHRMLNLEKLTLYLRIDYQYRFIDPIDLLNQFSTHLSQLNSFKFYLSVINNQNHFIKYLSNNNRNMKYQQTSDIVCFYNNEVTYHLFTLPFEFIKIFNIGNRFPNIRFNNVIELWVLDVVPFEHEFFLRISRAFPLLKNFVVTDFKSVLINDIHLSDNIQSYEIVKYPHLTALDLTRAGVSCVDQFLNENKTHLPRLNQLRIFYETLRITTENFTKEATRRNCANITRLITYRQFAGSQDYYSYFPLL
jgi:hypothetical protein